MSNISLGIGLKSKNIDGKWKLFLRLLDFVLKVNSRKRISDNSHVKGDWRRRWEVLSTVNTSGSSYILIL